MIYYLKKFCNDERGAITVDWVVLVAAIVGLTVLISTAMSDGVLNLTGLLTDYMSNWSF